jgi:hypothetical protein
VGEAVRAEVEVQGVGAVAGDVAVDRTAGDGERVGAAAEHDGAVEGAGRGDGRVATALVNTVAVAIAVPNSDAGCSAVDHSARADVHRAAWSRNSVDAGAEACASCDHAARHIDGVGSGRANRTNTIGIVRKGVNGAAAHLDDGPAGAIGLTKESDSIGPLRCCRSPLHHDLGIGRGCASSCRST